MKKLIILRAKWILTFLMSCIILSGCTSAVKSDKWTCFYQEEGKECRNYYDQSFTKVLDGSIASVEFVKEDFKGELSVDKLCHAIMADGYKISIKAPKDTLAWLNELLGIPNFFDKVLEKKEMLMYTPETKKFVLATMKYRSKHFEDLNENERTNVKRLNRMLMESLYEKECPKANYIIAVRVKSIGSDEEKNDYVESRKKQNLFISGYEDLKYSIFEFDVDCVRKIYRTLGQFDFNSKDVKLDGKIFPFSGWANVDNVTEGIIQRECR